MKHNGIQIDFSCPLDPEVGQRRAVVLGRTVELPLGRRLRLTGGQGQQPQGAGHDPVTVKSAKLSPDGKSVFLEIPDIKPVMQMSIEMDLKSAEKEPMKWTIYNTINKVPG